MNTFLEDPGRRRRAMNLGGTTSASQKQVFEQARVLRAARLEERQRHEAATTLQASWRGRAERRRIREEFRKVVEEDPRSIRAMRCLVLVKDNEVAGLWAQNICVAGEGKYLSQLFNVIR